MDTNLTRRSLLGTAAAGTILDVPDADRQPSSKSAAIDRGDFSQTPLAHLQAALRRHVESRVLPEVRSFSGGTLEDGLIQCLTWLALQSAGTVV